MRVSGGGGSGGRWAWLGERGGEGSGPGDAGGLEATGGGPGLLSCGSH